MNNLLAKIISAARAVRLPPLTPARMYNASVLAGLALVGAGAERAFGVAVALLVVGVLVLAFAVFERLLVLSVKFRTGR